MDEHDRLSHPHGQNAHPIRQEFILLSDVLSAFTVVGALNNPQVGNATESSILGLFFMDDAPDSKHILSLAC